MLVTAIPPQAGEAGGRHCDSARGGRSKRINVGEAALLKMPNKMKNA